jgi:hypothetical protein
MEPEHLKPGAHPGRWIGRALGGIAGLCLCLCFDASAQPSNDAEAARSLLLECTRLLDSGRLSEAVSRCNAAERRYHHPIYFLMLARISAKLGKPADARKYYEDFLAETGNTTDQELKEAREAAQRELIALFRSTAGAIKAVSETPAVVGRIQKPIIGVDVSRWSHPGLAADLGSPYLERCAKALSRAEFGAAGAVVLAASVSPEGAITGLSIRGEPMKNRGLDKPLPPGFLSCVRAALSGASIHREPNARATTLVGRYVVLLRKWPDELVVAGRTREKSP